MSSENNNKKRNKDILRRSIQVGLLMVITSVTLLLFSGNFKWIWAWVYIGIGVLILIVNSFMLPKEVMAERGKKKPDINKTDKLIISLNIIPTIGLIVIAGLDNRFLWTKEVSWASHIIGIILMFLGHFLFSWSMLANKYFSTVVRIQYDRDHTVSGSGPYQHIRHPGYVGYIIFTIATPLILGSFWALLPAALTSILLIIRTYYEDKTLIKELDGYKRYTKRVKYRLVPGIW